MLESVAKWMAISKPAISVTILILWAALAKLASGRSVIRFGGKRTWPGAVRTCLLLTQRGHQQLVCAQIVRRPEMA